MAMVSTATRRCEDDQVHARVLSSPTTTTTSHRLLITTPTLSASQSDDHARAGWVRRGSKGGA